MRENKLGSIYIRTACAAFSEIARDVAKPHHDGRARAEAREKTKHAAVLSTLLRWNFVAIRIA